jgi:hypothetical protein
LSCVLDESNIRTSYLFLLYHMDERVLFRTRCFVPFLSVSSFGIKCN